MQCVRRLDKCNFRLSESSVFAGPKMALWDHRRRQFTPPCLGSATSGYTHQLHIDYGIMQSRDCSFRAIRLGTSNRCGRYSILNSMTLSDASQCRVYGLLSKTTHETTT